MKQITFFLTVLLLTVSSCTDKTNKSGIVHKEEINVLNDSISKLMANYQMTKDSTLLLEAMKLSDKILSMDSTAIGQQSVNNTKVMILSLQGKKEEAFLLTDKAIPNDRNNIDRLIYNGVRYQIAQNKDSANLYFGLALNLCNQHLAKDPNNLEAFISKVGLYIYQGNKARAEKEIDDKLKTMPDNQLLKDLKGNLDNMCHQSEMFIKEMQK